MAGRLSVFVAVVLVMCAEFPRSNGFQWLEPTTSSIKSAPQVQQSVVYYPMASSVSVTMKWKWRLSGSEAFSGVFIKRHKVNDELNTEVHVASYLITVSGASETIDSNYYSQQVSTGKDGDIIFTIKDITKQTKNKDGGTVNVLALDGDYVFTCELNAANVKPSQRSSAIKLIVNEKPRITTPPQSQYINKANKEVKLTCTATGKPLDVNKDITWEIKMYGGFRSSKYGPNIYIYSFTRDDVGVYKCKVKNVYGEDTAEAFLQYTACASGCSSKDLAIEMKKLHYQDGYGDENSENYKKLKKQIETECLLLYNKQSDPKIYSCVVTRFRSGSVVAVMMLTFPSGTSDPDKPLRDAIETGKFAGYDVATSFVSPTSVYLYPTTEIHNFQGHTGSPGSGQRGTSSGGLSKGATVAIVVVFSIIFILIIVIIIVFMLRRKSTAPLNNQLPTIHGEQDTPSERRPQYNPAFETQQRVRLPVIPNEPPPPPYNLAFETEQRVRLPVIPNEPPPPYQKYNNSGLTVNVV